SSATTSDLPEGVRMSDNGNFQVIKEGVMVEFVPDASDRQAFEAGLQAIGAKVNDLDAGHMQVDTLGSIFSFRLNPMVHTSGSETTNLSEQMSHTVTFKSAGSLSNPDSYRIVAWYSDGTRQELLPYLHNMEALRAWTNGQGFDYRT